MKLSSYSDSFLKLRMPYLSFKSFILSLLMEKTFPVW
uniref:Uncharacterized protein n=1 Tax=Myoviridae sp. ctcaJ26 TaxID=2825138 RepID=A0A8S5NY19_9CAUD|nr:MAG TPA: hypothetical protein [Myoviridae sp. ctcaJ26]